MPKEELEIYDKHGTKFVNGVHKVRFNDIEKLDGEVQTVFGRPYLFVDVSTENNPIIYSQNNPTLKRISFVENQETVDDIRAEIIDFDDHKDDIILWYCKKHGLPLGMEEEARAINHIIDRVAKAMEDENNV